jgi:hypothetical protein
MKRCPIGEQGEHDEQIRIVIGNSFAGISGGVCVNHLWPVVAGGGGMTKEEALKMALVALETELAVDMTNGAEVGEAAELMCEAITAIKQALAAQPAVQEPIGYLFQHEETGLTTVVDVQQVEWGFEKNNPRHQNIGPVYTTPPAQPAVPDALNPKDENPAYAAGWNDCRAEMLKGMKP